MKYEETCFHCGDQLLRSLSPEISELRAVINGLKWRRSFKLRNQGRTCEHQAAYNKALDSKFGALGWETQPILKSQPRLVGDFRKGLVFVEVQFGNSASLYRDYYKFQYGLANGLLSLAVLIVPTVPKRFFPTRPSSVTNMADYAIAHKCLTVLPIDVPTMLIGLLPKN
jgi:hypothetical protein